MTARTAARQAKGCTQLHQALGKVAATASGIYGPECLGDSPLHGRRIHRTRNAFQAGHYPQHISINGRSGHFKADRAQSACGIVPDARQVAHLIILLGKYPAIPRDNLLGRPLEVPGAIIISQSLP